MRIPIFNMEVKKVLYINQAITPYLPESTIANLANALPQGIQGKGMEVRTFMPKYAYINERRNQLHEVIRLSGMNLIIDDTDHPLIIKVATLQEARMQVYFIYNDDYFQRGVVKELETETSPEDNDERSIFFVRGSLETVKKLRWIPDVVHCQGWISSLAALYLKNVYHDDPMFSNCKVVVSLFDENFENPLNPELPRKLRCDNIKDEAMASILNGDIDYVSLMKMAIDNADAVVEASEGVKPELIEYAKASGKPFLPFPGSENFVDSYSDFYKSL